MKPKLFLMIPKAKKTCFLDVLHGYTPSFHFLRAHFGHIYMEFGYFTPHFSPYLAIFCCVAFGLLWQVLDTQE